ncbi:MAG: hypothetical protein RLP15_09875 [Cryomorphaceae bacterium]
MKKVLLSLGLGLLSTIGFAQMSGTYTINSASPTSGTNFNSFTAAFSALTTQGVNAPVTINVIEATYNEQVYLYNKSISGASATNTVTIQSDAGNSSMPVWTSSSYPMYWQYCTMPYLTFDGLELTTSSTTGFIAYWRYMYAASNITMKNCLFTGGGYQIYNYYPYAYNLTIENCDFEDFYYRGIYSYYGYYPYCDIDVVNCEFHDGGSYSYPYGIYAYRPGAGSSFTGNLIELNGTSGGYGLYVYYPQGLSTNPIEVSNNIVNFTDPNDPYTQYGIFCSYGSYANIHHNTFKISNSYTSSRAVYMYMSSSSYQGNEFKNNIVSTPNSNQFGFYGYNYGGTSIDFENNVWYQGSSSGELYMYDGYAGGYMYTLSAWQSASGSSGSVSADPMFISNTNLTPQSNDVNNIGAALGYTEDFYGAPRSATTPDPGAIEFTVPTNNASISDLVKPDAPLCADDTAVLATLVNTGLVPLTSCTITYALNGSVQTSLVFSGSLATGSDTTLTIVASTTFSDGDSIAVWSSMPNGVQDSSALFDTASVVIYSGLTGTYNIPNDYPTLTAAASDVMLKGVCGHVTMSISPGTYTEQILLGEVLGAGADATLTWTSSSGNSADVIINYASTSGSDNQVVHLDGTDYVTFNDVTIRNNGTFYYATGVRIENGAENVTFDGCHIRAGEYGYTGNLLTSVYSYGQNHGLTLTNNTIEKGGYGLYV